VDRIVARVENDIILLSDVKELKEYQELVNGKSESDSAIVDRLIDQWIVRSEAELSRFPEPKDEEIDREVSRVVKSFSSAEEYEARKKQSGLNDAEVRKIVTAQFYLDNYLDSRFRPSVQIDEKAVEDFYQSAVVPRAKARGQEPPTLDASRDTIQDVLVQSDIDEQAARWLKESRDRLHEQKSATAFCPHEDEELSSGLARGVIRGSANRDAGQRVANGGGIEGQGKKLAGAGTHAANRQIEVGFGRTNHYRCRAAGVDAFHHFKRIFRVGVQVDNYHIALLLHHAGKVVQIGRIRRILANHSDGASRQSIGHGPAARLIRSDKEDGKLARARRVRTLRDWWHATPMSIYSPRCQAGK
jgi:hypothetical protein